MEKKEVLTKLNPSLDLVMEVEMLWHFNLPFVPKIFGFGLLYDISADKKQASFEPVLHMQLLESTWLLNFKDAVPVLWATRSKEEIYDFAIHLCNCIKLLHINSCRHGDLNAQNIIVDVDYSELSKAIFIIDYGSASHLYRATNCGCTDSYGGPEILKKTWRDYLNNPKDFSSLDCYALGALLFQLFTKEQYTLGFIKHDEKSDESSVFKDHGITRWKRLETFFWDEQKAEEKYSKYLNDL